MLKDWYFSDDNGVCDFRAAGVLIRNDKIFLQHVGNEYAVPGGHVSFGETSEEALIREFKEETGADIRCGRLIWVEEVFWKWGSKKTHGIAFYYLISLVNDKDLPDIYVEESNDSKGVMMRWVPIDDIKNLTVYPQYIKDKISCISDNIEHFVRKDW